VIKGSRVSDVLRLTSQDAGAVGRSLLGVLVLAVAALSWGPPGAATSAAAAGAIAGAAALQDNPLRRVPLVVAVSLQVGAAVLLGGLTSAYSAVFVCVAAVWCFAAGMAWAQSAHAGLIAAAAAALLITQPAQSVSAAAMSTVFAVAAGLTQAALIAVYPPRRWRVQRAALARAYRSLSADARILATNADAHVDTVPLMELREAFTSTDTAASRHPHSYRDFYAVPEQIAATVTALRSGPKGGDAVQNALVGAADVLGTIAGRSRTVRRDTEQARQRVDAAAAAVVGPETPALQRLSEQLRQAEVLRFGQLRGADIGDMLGSAGAHIRSHLTIDSPILRHAVRLSGAAAIGAAAARFAAVEHGYWIPLTVLLVLRPETAHTYTRCVGRVAGLAAGIVVASSVALLWHPTGMAAALLAVVFLGVTYAVSVFGYVAVSAALAMTIVFLIDITSVSDPATMADRLFAIAIGGALAVIAHVVLPDHPLIRLHQRAGELLKTEIDYAATVVKAFVHNLDHPSDALSAAWQRAFRSRSAFEAAAGAIRAESRQLRRWMRSYRTALNSVTSSCTALEASLPARPSTALDREFVLAVDNYVEALRGDPPTPATPWSIDVAQLTSANQRLRQAAALLASDDGAARVLVAEVATITRNLTGMAADVPDSAQS
jgi:uncharacterized membrane protein YccC